MNNIHNIMDEINNKGLCCACGACKSICPFHNIKMHYDLVKGRWDAITLDENICKQCRGICLTVCPSYEKNLHQITECYQQGLDAIKQVMTGWSNNNQIRRNSSSGGFIRSLSKQLLQQKQIDGVIALKFECGYHYYPHLYKTEAEIDRMPNSIYHQVNFENLFKILQSNNGKFLIIGLPCHFIALELFLQNKNCYEWRNKIYARISLICGYTFEHCIRDAFVYFKGVKQGFVSSYRECGRFRKTRIINSSNHQTKIYDIAKPRTLNEYIDNQLLMDRAMAQKSCLYCIDHLGLCADLNVGDAWLKRYSDDADGSNIIITRTDRGLSLLNIMDDFHFEAAKMADILESQSGIYAYGVIGHYLRSTLSPQHIVPEQVKIFSVQKEIGDISKKFTVKKLISAKKYNQGKFLYSILSWDKILKMKIIMLLKRFKRKVQL